MCLHVFIFDKTCSGGGESEVEGECCYLMPAGQFALNMGRSGDQIHMMI